MNEPGFQLSALEAEEQRLMCRVRDGDVEAFALLHRRHRPRVVNFLHRLGRDRDQAEDEAQEVFVKLWRARARYEPRARFTTYLYQIAENQWRDAARKARARPVEVELPPEGSPPSIARWRAPAADEPQRSLFLRHRQRAIHDAIAGLPERYRPVFILAHLEDVRLSEIAELLGVPIGTVKSRLHTAVRLLRVRLAEERDEGIHEV